MHTFLAHLSRTLALPALLLVAGNVTAAEIWIVADVRHPVAGAQAADRIIQLDAAQAIEAELSLPGSASGAWLGHQIRPLLAPIVLRAEPLPPAVKLGLAAAAIGIAALAVYAYMKKNRTAEE